MGVKNQYEKVDYTELQLLRREIAELRNEAAAFKAQSKLLENLISIAGFFYRRGSIKSSITNYIRCCYRTN